MAMNSGWIKVALVRYCVPEMSFISFSFLYCALLEHYEYLTRNAIIAHN